MTYICWDTYLFSGMDSNPHLHEPTLYSVSEINFFENFDEWESISLGEFLGKVKSWHLI